MNTSTSQTTDIAATDLEQLLAAAGFDFTVVERCPDAACDVCREKELSAAA